MGTVDSDVTALEEGLRLAELGPDPAFFEQALADDAVFVSPGEEPSFAKPKVVAAHHPGAGAKFTKVEMRDLKIIDHGNAAVVTCDGVYEGPDFTTTLRFMRVWLRMDERWQVIAATILPLD